jgi:hypothetical protein
MPKKTTKVAKKKIQELLKKSRMKKKQGYDAREDERLGMKRGKIAKKDFVGTPSEKEKSRRDDARFETRMPKMEYWGILQDMTGGVNADPRFDIYNTTMFAEDGMLVEYADPATKVTPLLAKMAMGGPLEHGLQVGDIILMIKDDFIGVINDNTGKMATVNIATGQRMEVEHLDHGGALSLHRPEKIENRDAREYVENKIPFIGNNLSGITMSNGDYLVSSYGYYPIYYYSKRENKFYGSKDKFSVTTAKHLSQARPNYDVIMVENEKMNEVIATSQEGNRFKRYGGYA